MRIFFAGKIYAEDYTINRKILYSCLFNYFYNITQFSQIRIDLENLFS